MYIKKYNVTLGHTITESIDGDGHALHDLVEWRLSSLAICLCRVGAVVLGHLGFLPCVDRFPQGHEDRECITVSKLLVFRDLHIAAVIDV